MVVRTKCKQGAQVTNPYCARTELFMSGQPSSVQIIIEPVYQNITPLFIFNGKACEYKKFALNVPIVWDSHIAMTRQSGRDNVDVIFLNSELGIQDIQVGVITRKGRFFITAQPVFQGRIRKDGEENMEFIPSLPEYAYPGMDYTKTWGEMSETIKIIAHVASDLSAFLGVPLEEVTPAQWAPPQIPDNKKWYKGTVLYFNAITGTGSILGEDGNRYFVHFSHILGNNTPVPMLYPMSGVYFRPDSTQTKVRSCKPA